VKPAQQRGRGLERAAPRRGAADRHELRVEELGIGLDLRVAKAVEREQRLPPRRLRRTAVLVGRSRRAADAQLAGFEPRRGAAIVRPASPETRSRSRPRFCPKSTSVFPDGDVVTATGSTSSVRRTGGPVGATSRAGSCSSSRTARQPASS
jgi:hypothetical protein